MTDAWKGFWPFLVFIVIIHSVLPFLPICFIRLFFIEGGGQIISEVVQEVQPVHPTSGECIGPSHSGV